MLVSRGIVGGFDAAHGNADTLDFIDIPWVDAGKRRLRRCTSGGLDFAISMEHDQYLFHGAILLDDEDHTVVVRRPEERALIIELGKNSVQEAALIGHAFGNQHIPIEVDSCSILVPVLTSEDLLAKTVLDLELAQLSMRFDIVRLGAFRPLLTRGHAHG